MHPIKIRSLGSFDRAALARELPGFLVDEDESPVQGIIVRSPPVSTPKHPELLAIARAGAGYDNIDDNSRDLLNARGIPLFTAPGTNARSVAELAFLGLGAFCRRFHEAERMLARHVGVHSAVQPAFFKHAKGELGPKGVELFGKTLGVVGFGAIGKELARLALGFDLNVVAHDPFATGAPPSGVAMEGKLEILLAQSDFVSVHVPLVPGAPPVIGEREVGFLKRGAVLVNTSRSGVVSGAAVGRALNEGSLRGYVTDVDEWIWLGDREEVLLLPHLGGSTEEAQERCVLAACESLREFFRRGAILRSVNFPETEPGPVPETCVRVSFANRNQPGMLAKVLDAIASHGFNVSGNVHHSRESVGYGVVDVDKVAPEEDYDRWGELIAAKIRKIPDVLMARLVG